MSGVLGPVTKEELVKTVRAYHPRFADDVAGYPAGYYTIDTTPLANMVNRCIDFDIEAMQNPRPRIAAGMALGFGAGLLVAHLLPANEYLELLLVSQWTYMGGKKGAKTAMPPSYASRQEIEWTRSILPLYIEHEATKESASMDKHGVLVVRTPETRYDIEVARTIGNEVLDFKRTDLIGRDHRVRRHVGLAMPSLHHEITREPAYVRGALRALASKFFEMDSAALDRAYRMGYL